MSLKLEVGNFQNLVARFTALVVKHDGRVFPVRRLDVFKIDFVECLFTTGGLLRFGGIGAKATDEVLEFLDLVLQLFVLIGALLECQLARLVPERVVTGVDVHLTEIYVYHMRTHCIEEVTVVRNHNGRILVIG